MDVLLSKITDLVMDIEENGHTTEENYSLLKEFDAAFDDILFVFFSLLGRIQNHHEK